MFMNVEKSGAVLLFRNVISILVSDDINSSDPPFYKEKYIPFTSSIPFKPL